MLRLESRIKKMEAMNDGPEPITEIIRRIIRPGDHVCIAEIREVIGREPVYIEFPDGEERHCQA